MGDGVPEADQRIAVGRRRAKGKLEMKDAEKLPAVQAKPRDEATEVAPRKFYVKKDDIDMFGKTQDVLGAGH